MLLYFSMHVLIIRASNIVDWSEQVFFAEETIRLNQKYLVLNSAEHMKPVDQI